MKSINSLFALFLIVLFCGVGYFVGHERGQPPDVTPAIKTEIGQLKADYKPVQEIVEKYKDPRPQIFLTINNIEAEKKKSINEFNNKSPDIQLDSIRNFLNARIRARSQLSEPPDAGI